MGIHTCSTWSNGAVVKRKKGEDELPQDRYDPRTTTRINPTAADVHIRTHSGGKECSAF